MPRRRRAARWHADVMSSDEPSGAYLEALRRGFQFARELDQRCGPVHVLVGVAEGSGSAAAALDPRQGRSLRDVAAASSRGDGAGYLHMQAQEAARSLAQARGERVVPEHLLIALLDQATPEVIQTLSLAGLESAAVRRAAAAAIGAADLPPVALPDLPAAGTMDRPALPVSELDRRAWTLLGWRQDHLPLDRLRWRGDREALSHLEWAAAWRLADRLRLDDDQRFSLISHHSAAVEQRVARDRPDLAGPPTAADRRNRAKARLRRHRRLRHLAGWVTWFGNRRVSLRDRWFRVRTAGYYRGAPQP